MSFHALVSGWSVILGKSPWSIQVQIPRSLRSGCYYLDTPRTLASWGHYQLSLSDANGFCRNKGHYKQQQPGPFLVRAEVP